MKTFEPITFDTLRVAGLLIATRGFANERSVYAIPSDMEQDARALVQFSNPTDSVSGSRFVPLANALPQDCSRAGSLLLDFDNGADYREFLTSQVGVGRE